MQCVIICCVRLCVVVIYAFMCSSKHSGDFDKLIKLFVCMLSVLILERSVYVYSILVTGYYIFAYK